MSRRIYLRPPQAADETAFLAAVRASRALHNPWVHPPRTPEQFATYVRRATEAPNCGWLVCHRADDGLVGTVTVSNMIHGLFRSAFTGYYAFSAYAGQGLMREGLQAAVRQAFGELGLHRLEANIQPGNARSIALARACGFQREGFSPKYLKIGGRWRDHERWAIVKG